MFLPLRNSHSNFGKAVFIVFFLTSCEPGLDVNNQVFLKKYGSQVAKINETRAKAVYEMNNPAAKNSNNQNSFSWNDPAKSMGIDGTFSTRSAIVDTSKLKLKEPKGEFLPNFDTFAQGQQIKNSIPEIFEVSYNFENYPTSYKRNNVSFDDIKIPGHDYFGIKSNLGLKEYKIIDHQILQKSLDLITDSENKEDKKIQQILLEEKKRIRKEKMAILLAQKEEKGDVKEIEEEDLIADNEDSLIEDFEENADENLTKKPAKLKKNNKNLKKNKVNKNYKKTQMKSLSSSTKQPVNDQEKPAKEDNSATNIF